MFIPFKKITLEKWSWEQNVSGLNIWGFYFLLHPFEDLVIQEQTSKEIWLQPPVEQMSAISGPCHGVWQLDVEPPPALAPRWPLTSSAESQKLCLNLQKRKQRKSKTNPSMHRLHTKQLRVQSVIVRCPWRRNTYLSFSQCLLVQHRIVFRYCSISFGD